MIREDSLFYLSGGPLAAIALGIALVPLRDFTPAANFTLVFMALTITVAEFGGRAAAMATALASALSLNFFLTQPYLRLTIDNQDDIVAFGGLAACGLIAAAFGSRRGRRLSELQAARNQLKLLHSASLALEHAAAEPELARTLETSRTVLPVGALALRDIRGYALAAAGPALERPVPVQALEYDSLLPVGGEPAAVGLGRLPLPSEGARLPLRAGNRQVGWLDLWGNGAPASIPSRHVLSDLARILAVVLAR